MPDKASDFTKGEQDFIHEYTRSLMVGWAHLAIGGGSVPDNPGQRGTPYFKYAMERGWLTKKEPCRPTAAGFKVAAAFLRR